MSANCQRRCTVFCGTRNDVPSSMLGKVYRGPVERDTMELSKSLRLTLKLLTLWDESTRVHVPSSEWYLLVASWRCAAEAIGRSPPLLATSLAFCPE